MFFNRIFFRFALFNFCFFLFLSTGTFAQTFIGVKPDFDLAPTYITGADAYDGILSDLDGDGNLDFITGNNANAAALTILYGKADGTFETAVVMPLNIYAGTVAAGDLNHDNKPDLVIASNYQNRMATIVNLGSRQFAAPIITIPPDPPNTFGEFVNVEIGDFNGDGNNDVVALQGSNNKKIRFFHYGSQGELIGFSSIRLSNLNNNTEGSIFMGKLNSDNLMDLVVFSESGGVRSINFVYGQSNGPLSLSNSIYLSDKLYSICINDLDGDGDNDLAIGLYDDTTPIRHSILLLTNSGNWAIDGNWSPLLDNPIILDYPFPPYGVTAGDFNNDGIMDLATLLYGDIIMINRGLGGMQYSEGVYYAVSPSSRIFAEDFNHDNRMDLLTASAYTVNLNRINVVLNDNLQGFKAPRAILWGSNYIGASDFNDDGFPDLLTAYGSDFTFTSTFNFLQNDYSRSGFFLPEVYYDTPRSMKGLNIGDFNGDGKKDVVTNHDFNDRCLGVYFNTGAGVFAQPPIRTTFTGGVLNTAVADFNLDGKDDVFAVDSSNKAYVMLSNGNGTFSPAMGSPFNVSSYNYDYRVADFNNDSFSDIISSEGVFAGDGTGRLVRTSLTLPSIYRTVVADFNRDGNVDIAGISNDEQLGSALIGIFGNGQGGISGIFTKPFSGDLLTVNSIAAADFDLDGYPDMAISMRQEDVYGRNEPGNLVVIHSTGSNSGWRQPLYHGIGLASEKIVTGDFNADGKPDIGYIGAKSRGVFLNTAVRKNKPFDFDGDGRADVSVYRPSAGAWYLNNSSSGFNSVNFGISTDKSVPADYDGDGKTDVAVFRDGNWYLLRSSAGFTAMNFGQAGDIPVPSDYDGDGKSEVAVYRSGNWYILNLVGNQFSAVSFGNATDKPVTGDFDGDGKADQAVFRPTEGYWYLNTSSQGVKVLGFGISTDKPIPADYDGDGKTDIAVYRDGNWYRLNSSNNQFVAVNFGLASDQPIPADYDGDGKADVAVFRNGNWYILQSSNGFTATAFGQAGDQPIPNVFIR